MLRKTKIIFLLMVVVLALNGCAMMTVDKLYCLPKRSEENENLQVVIDKAMTNLTYCAPLYGDNRLVWQVADLDGDGIDEYLVFAKDDSERPLKILIFCQLASGYVLMDTIEGYGFAFDYVSYAQMDDQPGLELIVGRQLNDELMGNVSVYRFSSGFSRLLMSTSYSQQTITDMDNDGIAELFLLTPGMSEKSNGAARIYRYANGELQRSVEIQLSFSIDGYKVMQKGKLETGRSVVYITGSADGQTLVTDIFAMENSKLVRFASGYATSAIRNYFVYPEDIDNDGVLELPRLVPLELVSEKSEQEYLIEWVSVNHDKSENIKRYTYHNFDDSWYLRLDSDMIDYLTVERTEDTCTFYWKDKRAFRIVALTDADRQEQAQQEGCTVLSSSETVIYVAYIEPDSAGWNVFTDVEMKLRFNPIRVDLNTEKDEKI